MSGPGFTIDNGGPVRIAGAPIELEAGIVFLGNCAGGLPVARVSDPVLVSPVSGAGFITNGSPGIRAC